ncbi:MAG: hypothetical protein WAX89_05800 [Alphaproteobacteria bacterium]
MLDGNTVVKSTAFCPAAILAAINNFPGYADPASIVAGGDGAAMQEWFKGQFAAINLQPYDGHLWGKGGDVAEVNDFLREKDFPDVQVSGQGTAAAGVFKVAINFAEPGTESTMKIGDESYQGAKFDSFDLRRLPDGRMVLKLAAAQAGWSLYLTPQAGVCDHYYVACMALWAFKDAQEVGDYKFVETPVCKFRDSVNVDWLVGMTIAGRRVDEALKKVVFEFDHLGAKGEAAVVIVTRSFSQPKVFRIDGPYIAFFHKDGMTEPAFAAHVAPDAWMKK